MCLLAASLNGPHPSCVLLRDCVSQRFVIVALKFVGVLASLCRVCRFEGFVSVVLNSTRLSIRDCEDIPLTALQVSGSYLMECCKIVYLNTV